MADDGSDRRQRVCVVGAGAAGICAARHLAADPTSFTFEVFEQNGCLGGTWVYSENTGVDEYGIPAHSSMYKNLKTNFLQEVMAYPDHQFPEATNCSYPSHDIVLNYLQSYAEKYALLKYIRFRTVVQSVRPGKEQNSWSVVIYDAIAKIHETKEYDAIMICNGSYTKPDIPSILGIEAFKGDVMHCHYYRTPDKYKGMVVAVLGASFSGKDISIEISSVAEKVYLCHSLPPIPSKLPNNIQEVPSIKSAKEDGFILNDNSFIQVNAVLYCTGYLNDLPFLRPECGITIRGKRIRPLYKHLINIEVPTMALVGVPYIIVPFSFFYFQVAYFLKTLKKPSILPTKNEMYEDEEHEFQMRIEMGYPTRHAHKMAQLQWDYNDQLADIAGIPRLAPVFRELCQMNTDRMTNFFAEYRKDCYAEIYKQKMQLPENKVKYNLEKFAHDGE